MIKINIDKMPRIKHIRFNLLYFMYNFITFARERLINFDVASVVMLVIVSVRL